MQYIITCSMQYIVTMGPLMYSLFVLYFVLTFLLAAFTVLSASRL